MTTQKTFPGTAAQPEQGADAVLASAAQTAQPGAQPEVQGQPPELATQVDQAATHGSNEPEPTIQAVYSLERARALPELHQDAYVPFESDDPKAILAFKDADDRTMRVAVDLNCLAKIEVRREPVA